MASGLIGHLQDIFISRRIHWSFDGSLSTNYWLLGGVTVSNPHSTSIFGICFYFILFLVVYLKVILTHVAWFISGHFLFWSLVNYVSYDTIYDDFWMMLFLLCWLLLSARHSFTKDLPSYIRITFHLLVSEGIPLFQALQWSRWFIFSSTYDVYCWDVYLSAKQLQGGLVAHHITYRLQCSVRVHVSIRHISPYSTCTVQCVSRLYNLLMGGVVF